MNTDKPKKILKLNSEKEYEVVEVREEKKKYSKTSLPVLIQSAEAGFSIAIPIVLGVGAGLWLDSKFNTHPKFMLSLLIVGVFFAFTNLFLIVKNNIKK